MRPIATNHNTTTKLVKNAIEKLRTSTTTLEGKPTYAVGKRMIGLPC